MAQNPTSGPTPETAGPPNQVEEEQRVMALSTTHFFAGRYDACIQALQSLGSQADHRARHNELVAKYYKLGATPQATEGLLGALTKLLEEHPLASANYNCAVLNFQLQHYPKTLDILFKIFTRLEPYEEYLTMRSAFLLIETCFRMKNLEKNTLQKAMALLERALPQLKTNNGAQAEPEKQPDQQDPGLLPPMPTPAELKVILQNIRARLYLIFNATKSAKNELKPLIEICSEGDPTPSFLRCHLECLEANYPQAIKHLNSVKPSSLSLENKIIYYNSMGCIHLRMLKYAAASFYFKKALDCNTKALGPWGSGDSEALSPEESSPEKHTHKRHPFSIDKSSSILYNYALSLLFRGKASLAFSCFQYSLQLTYHRPHIWLRLGESCVVHHLKKKRKILRKKRQQTSNEKSQEIPSYVLIQDIIEGNKSGRILLLDSDHDQFNKDSRSILPPPPRPSVKGESTTEWSAPQIGLPYGLSCFLNLIHLLDVSLNQTSKKVEQKEKDEHASEEESFEDAELETPEKKTKGPNWEQWQKLKANRVILKLCAHVNIAWISLQNNDPVLVITHSRIALDLCQQIIKADGPSPVVTTYEYLATVYLSEANILSNKLSEALEVITQFLKKNEACDVDLGLAFDPDLGWEIAESTETNSTLAANVKSSLFANLATIHIIKGDIEAAKKCCASASALNKNFAPILLIEIYIALVTNKVDVALEILASQNFSPVELLALRGRPNKT